MVKFCFGAKLASSEGEGVRGSSSSKMDDDEEGVQAEYTTLYGFFSAEEGVATRLEK